MQSTRNIVILSLAFVALGFSGWLYVHNQTLEEPQLHTRNQHRDASGLGIRVKQFDKQGKLAREFTTPKVIHYPEHNTSVFIKPHLIVHRPDQPVWTISAKRGKAIEGNKQVDLVGQVSIQQAADNKNPATDIHTSELHFFPSKQLATTSKLIRMHQPGIMISATGMRAHLDSHHIELLSNTKAVYHPDQRKAKL